MHHVYKIEKIAQERERESGKIVIRIEEWSVGRLHLLNNNVYVHKCEL